MDNKEQPKVSDDFLEALGQRESSGDYTSVNELGYLGKYQFGGSALQDLGYKDASGKWLGKDNIKSKEDFLKNKKVQEAAVRQWFPKVKSYLKNKGAYKHIGSKFNDITVTEQGLMAAAHLVGAGAVNEMLTTGVVPKDANGVKATEYLKKFADPNPMSKKTADLDTISKRVENEKLPEDIINNIHKGAKALNLSREKHTPNSVEDNLKLIERYSKRSGDNDLDNAYGKVIEFSQQKAAEYERRNKQLGDDSTVGSVVNFIGETVPKAPSYITENIKKIPDITKEDLNAFTNDFSNTVMERTIGGGLIKKGMLELETDGKIDPNFDPKADEIFFKEMTKDLSPDQLKTLLEDYSYNKEDFTKAATMLSMRSDRLKEMDEYTKENPVLSGLNGAGALLTDAALFMPVGTAVANFGLARMAGTTLKSLKGAKKLGAFAAAETVEQGVYETAASSLVEGYEFSPELFMAGIAAGTGLRHIAHKVENNKVMKELLQNEGGFINLSLKDAKKLVKEVAKETDDKVKLQIIENLANGKVRRSNEIRKKLMQQFDHNNAQVQSLKKKLKNTKKSSPEYKKTKGELQTAVRRAKREESNIQQQLKMVVEGTHPHLKVAFNKDFAIKNMVKEFGIDPKEISKPEDIRKFFNLEQGNLAENIVIEGEAGYEMVMKKQIEELKNNPRLNANTLFKQVSDQMETLPFNTEKGLMKFVKTNLNNVADTDGFVTKYAFNKANLTNSENPYVASFYNLLSPDSGGRLGESAIRLNELKEVYSNNFYGSLMDNYKTTSYEMLKELYKDSGIKKAFKLSMDFHAIEREVLPILDDRLRLPKEVFDRKYPSSKIRELADDFTKKYNDLNNSIAKKAEEMGVEGAGAASDNFIHRAWASNKARLVPKKDLEAAFEVAMRKSLLENGLPVEESFLKEQARNFVYGIQNKDITNNIQATEDYLDSLQRFLKSKEGQSSEAVSEAIESEIRATQSRSMANDLKELGKRAELDINVEIPNTNGMKLSELMEDNFIETMSRYNSRMAARIAAAEKGIKNVNMLDAWKSDALKAEKKRLIAKNDSNIEANIKFLDDAMSQDIKAFKYGGLGGKGDTIDADANDVIRFLKKLSAANLLRDVGIASIAEAGGTVAEVGLLNSVKPFIDAFSFTANRAHMLKTPAQRTASITDEMTALTGIGFEEMTYTSRGISKAQQIYQDGVMNQVEGAVDTMGSLTKGTFGWIENTIRRGTSNAIAIKWGRHFNGTDEAGLIGSFLKGNKTTNRTLENAGLGTWVKENGEEVFKTNKVYDKIKENYMKHVEFDNGTAKRMNFEKWDREAKDAFRDVVKMQATHILVNTDSTTSALWMNEGIMQLFNQFRSFSVNAMSKVTGFAFGNLKNGIKHNDAHEVMKFANKMFWSSAMGAYAVGLREEIKYAGTGRNDVGFNKLIESPADALTIGFFRSAVSGSLDMVTATGAQLTGLPNPAQASTFTNRGSFFDLSKKPTGQLVQRGFDFSSSLIQGDVDKAGENLMKATPFANQIGIQQMINYLNK